LLTATLNSPKSISITKSHRERFFLKIMMSAECRKKERKWEGYNKKGVSTNRYIIEI